jgi:putative phosphoesterase
MLLGVVSDTHGHIEHTRPAIRMLESLAVDVVIHCGDIGSVDIIQMFAAWPTHFVFGNVDYDADLLRRAMAVAGQTCHDRFGSLELSDRKIAFLHGDDARRFEETVEGQQYDLVCYGHTHIAKQEQRGRTVVLNPGAVHRATPHSLAVVQLPEMQVTMVPV